MLLFLNGTQKRLPYVSRAPVTKCISLKFIHRIVEGDAYVSSETPLGDNSVRVQSPKRVFLIYSPPHRHICVL